MAVERGINPKDIIGGVLMIVVGLFFAIWAKTHYNIGVPSRMGPGWFPLHLGYLLAILGVIITIPALFRKGGGLEHVQWRPMFWLTASVIGFALTVKWIGLVPAVFIQVGLSVLGDTKLKLKGTIILASLTAFACHLIFYKGLDVQLPPFVWPF